MQNNANHKFMSNIATTDDTDTQTPGTPDDSPSTESAPLPNPPENVTYIIDVAVRDKKNAGTDDVVNIVLFGTNGSSNKFRLNTAADDFRRGKVSTFSYKATEYNKFKGKDLGEIYAITLNKEGHDAIYVDYVEVIYRVEGEDDTTCRFTLNDVLGDRGDFNLPEDLNTVTKLADGYVKEDNVRPITQNIGEMWIVLDNRAGSKPLPYEETLKLQVSSDVFYGRLVQDETKAHYGFAYEVDSGWFGADYKFSVDLEHNTLKEVTNNETLTKTFIQEIKPSYSANKNTLLFVKYVITANGNYTCYSNENSSNFDINILKSEPGFHNTGAQALEFGQHDVLSEELANIYQAVLGKPFVKI